jgi:hypothetical protein
MTHACDPNAREPTRFRRARIADRLSCHRQMSNRSSRMVDECAQRPSRHERASVACSSGELTARPDSAASESGLPRARCRRTSSNDACTVMHVVDVGARWLRGVVHVPADDDRRDGDRPAPDRGSLHQSREDRCAHEADQAQHLLVHDTTVRCGDARRRPDICRRGEAANLLRLPRIMRMQTICMVRRGCGTCALPLLRPCGVSPHR